MTTVLTAKEYRDLIAQPASVDFIVSCKEAGLPAPVTELRFDPLRQWRFDYAWPDAMLALEIEGGIFKRKGARKCQFCGQTPQGRHSTGSGMMKDIEKYNAAVLHGWRLLRATPDMVENGEALTMIKRALGPLLGTK